jgi:hypothetical protein
MAVRDIHSNKRYTAVGDKGKKGHLSRTVLIAQKKNCQCRNVLTCMAMEGMHGSGRHAWQWETCMAVRGIYGSRRHA